METKELTLWKNKLLDLGKRNNMLNFRDTKSGTIDIVYPDLETVFEKVKNPNTVLQMYDDKLTYKEEAFDLLDGKDFEEIPYSKEDHVKRFKDKLRSNQVLLFKSRTPFKPIVRNLKRKALDAITERGVNILYIAFGFVRYKETGESKIWYNAPILLVPISITSQSATSPFYINICDEDILLNPTFKFLLESNYNLKLPEYTDEPLNEYFAKIQKLVDRYGWSVLKCATIGTFSFAKINMYFDIAKNSDKIAKNRNVALLSGEPMKKSEVQAMQSEIENKKNLFIEQNNVVDADFSQAEAIQYALMGKSFVLQGPPGTGKSQTITNMIAELLNAGKKVLFVSEKMAALEVVYNNLRKVGLNEFCLELHSYKANKKEFVDELYKTLMADKTMVKESIDRNQKELEALKERLDLYSDELYKMYEPLHMTPYELITKINHAHNSIDLGYVFSNIDQYSQDAFLEHLELLKKYSIGESSLGSSYEAHPLYGFYMEDTSYGAKVKLQEFLEAASKNVNYLEACFLKGKADYHVSCRDIEELKDFKKLLSLLSDNGIWKKEMISIEGLESLLEELSILKENGVAILKSKNVFEEVYYENITNFRAEEYYVTYTTKYASGLKRLLSKKYKKMRFTLRACQKNPTKKLSYEEELKLLKELDNYQKSQAMYQKHLTISEDTLATFQGLSTDWDTLLNDIEAILSLLKKHKSFSKLVLVQKKEEAFTGVKSFLKEATRELNIFEKNQKAFGKYFDETIFDVKTASLDEIGQKLSIIEEHFTEIDSWMNFLKLMQKIKDNGLLPFIKKTQEKKCPKEKLVSTYMDSYYKQWLDYILSKAPSLKEYPRLYHDADVLSFKEHDNLQFEISKAKIREHLSQNRPNIEMAIQGSPAKIIEREYEKKRKIKPIRTLMQEIPEFIQRIKPCFLMSPLSVSTYLSEDTEFDVTIFDEASQVFPEDAIVAIYRSKQLIVVGDSKQMPPSNFFMATDTDEDDYLEEASDITGFESILDLCSSVLPKKSLLYHYRSKDESLITFSNKNFYHFNLITFPSVTNNELDRGVEFTFVENGVYDRERRANYREAEKVVECVYDHFKRYPERSLGVVAFNQSQQNLILNLLAKKRESCPDFEVFFRDDHKDPFFVKNLETVQGDERDTIIFSITYGYDAKGSFALRFGPLNLVGGERRLNVAITRAKINLKVISSIHASDIDLSRVTNDGPRLLHDYLAYVEHGAYPLLREDEFKPYEENRTFIEDIASFLKQEGFVVDKEVGSSKFKIDLGLKDPETMKYALAIECDGDTYHRANSTRDRDRLRQAILEGMDWQYYRVWSIDWLFNKEKEKKALVEACQKALQKEMIKPIEKTEPTIVLDDEIIMKSINPITDLYDIHQEVDTKDEAVKKLSTNDLVLQIVSKEAPIALEYLLKRTIYHFMDWGASTERVTPSVIKNFHSTFDSPLVEERNGFLYVEGSELLSMRKYSENPKENSHFEVKYISPVELRNGMYQALSYHGASTKEELYEFIRKSLGYQRMSDTLRKQLDKGFILLKEYVSIADDGLIRLSIKKPLEIKHRQ